MKNIFYILVLLFTSTLSSQIDINQIIPEFTPLETPEPCKTDQNLSPNLINLETIKGLDHTNDEFYIKLYIHTLHKEQEPHYGFTTEAINRLLKHLYDDFDPLGIHFVWDGIVDEIYDDSIAFPSSTGSNFNDIFNTNNHQDGIDIYLADELLSGGNFFVSNGIGNSTEMFIAGFSKSWEITPLSWHKYVSHTMGHILFLYDTQWGTSIHEPYNCAESADGSNGTTCGDYIADTPADPGLYFYNVNPSDCSFDPQFYGIPLVDPISGLNYDPDTGNIMSLTSPNCYTNFTHGQKKRMKNAIWYIPALHSTLLTNWNYIRTIGEDCYVCDTSNFTFYTSNDANLFNVLETSTNISATFVPNDPVSATVTVTNLNQGSDEGSSGYFNIGHYINDNPNVTQAIWAGKPQTVSDSQLTGTDYIAHAGDPAGHVLENNNWLGGTDYYSWSFPAPYHPVHWYDSGSVDPTYWQYADYAKHFFFASTISSGEQTGKVTVKGVNPCGEGYNGGQSNELCVVNADDPEGDTECGPLPFPIVYYPNPVNSLLQIDLSLQDYKIYTVLIYDENQTVKYSDQTTNIVKTVDVFNLINGTYYLHIYDDSNNAILSRILIINH